MAETYEIDAERELVISRAWDELTGEDLLGHQERMRMDPAFRPFYKQLVDLRELVCISATHQELLSIATNTLFHAGIRRAFVAPRDAIFGLGRMFEQYSSLADQNVRVFRDFEEAERWLAAPGGND